MMSNGILEFKSCTIQVEIRVCKELLFEHFTPPKPELFPRHIHGLNIGMYTLLLALKFLFFWIKIWCYLMLTAV